MASQKSCAGAAGCEPMAHIGSWPWIRKANFFGWWLGDDLWWFTSLPHALGDFTHHWPIIYHHVASGNQTWQWKLSYTWRSTCENYLLQSWVMGCPLARLVTGGWPEFIQGKPPRSGMLVFKSQSTVTIVPFAIVFCKFLANRIAIQGLHLGFTLWVFDHGIASPEGPTTINH